MSALALLAGLVVSAYVWASRAVPWPGRRTLCFVTGCFLAVLAPGFGDEELARHMAEHGVMISIAAPLIAIAAPLSLLSRCLSPRHRTRLGEILGSRLARRVVMLSPVLFVISVWIVHVPAVIEWVDELPALHALEHVVLVSLAVVFWSFCLGRLPGPRPAAVVRAAVLLSAAPACDFAAIGLMVGGHTDAGAVMLASTLPIAVAGAASLWRAAIAEERQVDRLERRLSSVA